MMEKFKIFFRNTWQWIGGKFFSFTNFLSTNFNKIWIKNNFYKFFAVMIIFFVVIIFFIFSIEKKQRENTKKNEIYFNFDGDYSSLEKEIVVGKGHYIINVQKENGFSVLRYKAKNPVFYPVFSPEFFLAFSFDNGEVKKMDGDFSQIHIPYKGKLKIWVKFNPKFFNPMIDRVQTVVKLPSGLLREWDLIVSIKKADKFYPWIPKVVDIPKPQPSAPPEPEKGKEARAKKNKKTFFQGLSDEFKDLKKFIGFIPEKELKKQKKIQKEDLDDFFKQFGLVDKPKKEAKK